MKYIRLYEEYSDPLGGTRDLFSLRETITLKDTFGNKVVFQGPSESLELAIEITSKAKGPLSTIRAATWNRNRNQEIMDSVLIPIREELKGIGWEIIEWFGGLTPEEKEKIRSEYDVRLKEGYEDPLKGSEETRDLFDLTYRKDLNTGAYSEDYYIEGPSENKELADKIADWIEDELTYVYNEHDDLVNGESEALEQVDAKWEEMKASDDLAERLARIGYILKKYED